jgi:hypothetical protein
MAQVPAPRTAASDADRILAEARSSLVRNRAGGRRRGSIGEGSAAMKRAVTLARFKRMGTSVAAILVAAFVAGIVIDGIGITGILLTGLAIFAAIALFSQFPRLRVPDLAKLNTGDVRTMVGNTELWLESQRRALPAPAVQVVDHLGLQLDALGRQLEGLDPAIPAVGEVRKLVGEHLPELVSAYTSIPPHLRGEARGGRTADEQLADSLGKISAEIDSVSRQLAEGQIDNLAIRTRYLDYRYGGGIDEGPA